MSNNDPMPFFIAFSGKKQSGKDTAAAIAGQFLTGQGKRVAMTAFAEPLKRMCVEVLGLDPAGIYGTDEEKNAPSHIMWDGFPIEVRQKYADPAVGIWDDTKPRSGSMTNREVLQVMGTDIFRAIYGDVWAEAPFRKDWTDIDVVILTDCRFPNEKIVTEKHGGVTIRLERDTGFKDNHASETSLDDAEFEHKYINNKTLSDLELYVCGKMMELGLA